MMAYEFYLRNDQGSEHLIGILPERRRDSERITRESAMKWVKKILRNNKDLKKIFYIKVQV